MRGRGTTSLLLWLVFVAVGCAQAPPSTTGTIESMGVHITVRDDGGLDVLETLRVAPSGNRVELARVVASPYADAVSYRAASIDGQPIEAGTAGLNVEGDERRLDTLWRLDTQASVTFGLDYVVTAAVGVREPRGSLEFPVLAAGRGFDVGEMVVTLVVPDGAFIYDGTGMAEAGWTVEIVAGRVTARREQVAAHESATLLAVFDVDRSRVQQGRWEWNLDRAQQYRLALIAAGLFILVIGVGILVQLRVQYPPVAPDAPDAARHESRADREMLARGLRLSAIVGLVLAAASAAVARQWLSGLGPPVQLIPGSMAFVSVMFLAAAYWYRRGHRV